MPTNTTDGYITVSDETEGRRAVVAPGEQFPDWTMGTYEDARGRQVPYVSEINYAEPAGGGPRAQDGTEPDPSGPVAGPHQFSGLVHQAVPDAADKPLEERSVPELRELYRLLIGVAPAASLRKDALLATIRERGNPNGSNVPSVEQVEA